MGKSNTLDSLKLDQMETFEITLEMIENSSPFSNVKAKTIDNKIQPKTETQFSDVVLERTEIQNSKMNKITSKMEGVLQEMISEGVRMENVLSFLLLEIDWRILLNENPDDEPRQNQWIQVRRGILHLMK